MTIKLRQATVTREFDNWQRANNYGPYQMRARALGIGPNIIEPAVNAHDALMAVYAAADAAMVFLAENGYGGTPVERALLDALEGCGEEIEQPSGACR